MIDLKPRYESCCGSTKPVVSFERLLLRNTDLVGTNSFRIHQNKEGSRQVVFVSIDRPRVPADISSFMRTDSYFIDLNNCSYVRQKKRKLSRQMKTGVDPLSLLQNSQVSSSKIALSCL